VPSNNVGCGTPGNKITEKANARQMKRVGEIFREIKNKIQSGYNLREIIDHIDELRFRSQTEKHELSHLYEAKIKNMGNAGRNGGEYYTPRPLIRAIIQVVKSIFCLSFLMCSSFRASSSLGRARRPFSAPSRKRSCQSSISATVSPCFRAACWTEVSPFRMFTTRATRRFAVQRWTVGRVVRHRRPPPAVIESQLVGGLNFEGSNSFWCIAGCRT
jgi:N-6 DNA methylase